jgi:3-hydroxypropanoate dehydrogenase
MRPGEIARAEDPGDPQHSRGETAAVTGKLDAESLDRIFRTARTHVAWRDQPVGPELLQEVYELARMGPTSANCCPMRIVFVCSHAAKQRLRPALDEGNVAKTMAAPATAIIGYDLAFPDRLSELFPHEDARSWFEGNDVLIRETAFRNGSLQGAYFIVAARALGLDCGPMSGFDKAMVDRSFFADSTIRSNFLCNLGYGDPAALRPRSPRLGFADACRID